MYAAALESLFEVASPKLQQTKTLTIDMVQVQELDTLGAWLLEKITRRARESGHSVSVVALPIATRA